MNIKLTDNRQTISADQTLWGAQVIYSGSQKNFLQPAVLQSQINFINGSYTFKTASAGRTGWVLGVHNA